jgi:5-methyltetrahydropteroyltriglutamate--homocysteine methyltransferase
LKSLDVPADRVRHPAVFGKLSRKQPLALHELEFTQSITDRPVKVALPGPYLLTRTMWMECITDKAYDNREMLAADIVRILREEISDLMKAGAALIQLDEPVLTEIVYNKPEGGRTFMCGALGERKPVDEELAFARALINAVTDGFERSRLALHVCRGNWTPDESAALAGDYTPLIPVLADISVGTLFLEFCTPRAGDIAVLGQLPEGIRVGLGVVNPKTKQVETVEEILAKVRQAENYISRDRLLLNPDCGFATFADNPVSTASVASAKLAAMVQASRELL